MTLDSTDLSPLGAALEDGRRATGLSTEAFLRAKGLAFRTWRRLLRGEPAPAGQPPREATVVRYGRAAGLDKDTALTLARRTYLPPKVEELTRLGAALEERRLATGVDTRPFLLGRGLSSSTWYRLLYGAGAVPADDTVVKYAAAVGLDRATAAGLFREDCRSGRFSRRSGHQVVSAVAAEAAPGGIVGDLVVPAGR